MCLCLTCIPERLTLLCQVPTQSSGKLAEPLQLLKLHAVVVCQQCRVFHIVSVRVKDILEMCLA
jgi:hypothetical protein